MPDLQILKQRVEHAERRFQTMRSARQQECEALIDMWQQIRNKFRDQERQIADYRSKLSSLQDVNVELVSMIDSMLGSMEGSADKSFDQAVPEITSMARQLLESEPASDAEFLDISLDQGDEIIVAPELESRIVGQQPTAPPSDWPPGSSNPFSSTAASDAQSSDYASESGEHSAHDDGGIVELTEHAQAAQSATPRIRNLITRIERAVNRPGSEGTPDAEIDREIEEIEHLRNELNGLRDRISAPGPAE